MKSKALDQIEKNLEQIVLKLTEAGQRNVQFKHPEVTLPRFAPHKASKPDPFTGSLPPQEFDSLRLAQDTLGLLRRTRGK